VCLCVCAFVLLILCFGEMQMYDIFPLPQPRFRLESLFSATMPPEALEIICSPVCLCLSVTVGVGVFVLSLSVSVSVILRCDCLFSLVAFCLLSLLCLVAALSLSLSVSFSLYVCMGVVFFSGSLPCPCEPCCN